MKHLVLALGIGLVAAFPAEARIDCNLASTASMARLLRFSCHTGSAQWSGQNQIVPPPDILRIIERVAPQSGLETKLVMAVIAAESAFDVRAVSPRNAQGLMQLLPATAARFGVRDPFNAEDNIRGGTAYLHWLLGKFDGNLDLALAAYNAGEAIVLAARAVPPFDETVEYIGRVKRFYGLYQRSR